MQSISVEISSDGITQLVDTVVDAIREDHFDDLSDKIYDSVVDEVKDNINDWIELDDLDIENKVTSTIEDLLGQFSPGNHCSMGRAVEDIIKDGFIYAIENDDDFARNLGSFIDKWIWKPSDEKHPEDSIKAMLGREDASNIHDLSVPVIPVDASDKLALTKEQIQDIIYLTAVTCSGLIGGVRDVNMFKLTSASKISMPQFIQDFLNK